MSELALKLIAENIAAHERGDESCKRLDIGNCGLTELPEELFDCVWLEELVVSNEYWKRDSEDMEAGSWVTSVNNGEKNDISLIPNAIGSLENLKILVLEGEPSFKWEITRIPPLTNLVNLETLYLGHNKITDITPVSGLVNLRYLYLSVNEITASGRLCGLEHLKLVVLSHNKINSTHFLSRLPSLEALDLNFNQITDIGSLVEFTGLTFLDLGSNSLVAIDVMPKLPNLKILFLSANQILDYTPLSALIGLETLKLSHNRLGEVDFLRTLVNLKSLFLSDNEIIDITILGELAGLRTLSLRTNQIKDVSSLETLKNLQSLDLSHNLLIKVPSLVCMIDLVNLNLERNPITILNNIPDILNLPSLQELMLFGITTNNMHIPRELFGKGSGQNSLSELKSYFSSLRGGIVRILEVPVILVGNSTSGKTSLRHFIQENLYPPKDDHSTHGIESSVWYPDKKLAETWGISPHENIQFYFWDFGGQEYYHSTHRLFFSEKAIYILVWEQKTNKPGSHLTKIKILNSKREIEYLDLPVESFSYKYWINSIRSEAPNIEDSPIFLLQNKIDEDHNTLTENPDSDLVRSNNCQVLQISVKRASERQEKGEKDPYFEIFLEKLFSTSKQFKFEVTRSISWEPIKEVIYINRQENIWTIARLKEKLVMHDVHIDEDSIAAHLRSLDALGIVLHDPNDEILGEYIFINPGWVIETIYGILDQSVRENNGAFERKHMVDRVGENSEKFLQLMKRFELIFEDEPDYYIAPQYLPAELDNRQKKKELAQMFDLESFDLIEQKKPDFILNLTDFMPRYIMLRFVAAYGHRAVGKYYWKNGIAFTLEKTDVLVVCKPNDNEFRIYVSGSNKRVQRLVFDKLVMLCPSKNSLLMSIDGTNFLKYDNLEQAFAYKQSTVVSEQKNGVQFSNFKHFFENMEDVIVNGSPEVNALPSVKIFISYAHLDDDVRDIFETRYLNPIIKSYKGKVGYWSDKKIKPATKWDRSITNELEASDLVLFFLSNSFLGSDYIESVEIKMALERYEKREQIIVPIYIERIAKRLLPFSDKQYLPGGEPLKTYKDQNEAWILVQDGLFKIIDDVIAGKTSEYFD